LKFAKKDLGEFDGSQYSQYMDVISEIESSLMYAKERDEYAKEKEEENKKLKADYEKIKKDNENIILKYNNLKELMKRVYKEDENNDFISITKKQKTNE